MLRNEAFAIFLTLHRRPLHFLLRYDMNYIRRMCYSGKQKVRHKIYGH